MTARTPEMPPPAPGSVRRVQALAVRLDETAARVKATTTNSVIARTSLRSGVLAWVKIANLPRSYQRDAGEPRALNWGNRNG